MAFSCNNQDCTVAATGKCLLLHEPPETCPHIVDREQAVTPPAEEPAGSDGNFEDNVARRFFPGNELGSADAAELMRGRYGTLIVVLGQYDAGKTCFLASLYLMTACRGIGDDLVFAGSLTLNGFEARARKMREWKNGALPKQLADHTNLADERAASLVHLALREREAGRRQFDLLITDLPGEWSTDLISNAEVASRFRFIDRADGIVITLDGPMLNGPGRHTAINNAKLLITRMAETLGVDRSMPLVLMVTKCDELEMQVPPATARVEEHARQYGFEPKVIPVAAISRNSEKVASGTGVMDVIEYILDRKDQPEARTPASFVSASARHFARIRE